MATYISVDVKYDIITIICDLNIVQLAIIMIVITTFKKILELNT